MSSREIVLIEFPFSNLSEVKKRPALILGEKGEDIIICAITSNPNVKGINPTFEGNKLPLKSTIKYWQIQTTLKTRATKVVGKITEECHKKTVEEIKKLFLE